MSKGFIPLSVPDTKGNELKYVKECIDTSWVSSAGKYVDRFETKFRKVTGSKNAVACINGTAALHISLILAGVGPGDEVIVPTVTFIAPINAVHYVGAYPVFMDCDDRLNIDFEKTIEFIKNKCIVSKGKLVNKTTKRAVKAIIPVHVFGNPVDLEPLTRISKQFGLSIIEDATESLGSYYQKGHLKGKMTGTIGDFGCFSFNGNKIITTGGGGMIVTRDKQQAEKARYLTTQAKDDENLYVHNEVGYNYRLTNIAAAIGVAQIEKLSKYIQIKRKNFKLYKKLLSGIDGLTLIDEPEYGFSNYWFYSLLVDKKCFGMNNIQLMKRLSTKGIQSRPLWCLNHLQRPYKNCQTYKIEKAFEYYDKVLNLPCSVGLKNEEIEKVVKSIIKRDAQ